MIYACDLEVILSLSPVAMEHVEHAVRYISTGDRRTDQELRGFANALRAELDKARTLSPQSDNLKSGNEDLI